MKKLLLSLIISYSISTCMFIVIISIQNVEIKNLKKQVNKIENNIKGYDEKVKRIIDQNFQILANGWESFSED